MPAPLVSALLPASCQAMAGLIDDGDAAQPLHGANRFPAGDDESQRIPVMRADRLAILGVRHQRVVHALGQRNAHGVLVGFRSFGDHPARAGLHAALLEQDRQQHPGPFAAAGSAVHQLHRIAVRTTKRAAVRVAFEEIDFRDRGEAPQFIHRETEGPIDHAVHQQAMLLRIDIRNAVDVVHQEVQARWRDDPIEILKRCRQRAIGDRSAGTGGPPHRVVELRGLSVGQGRP